MAVFENEKRLKEKANKLPTSPGVYIMKNVDGTVIYVGKAKALKNRVTQYFGSHLNHSAKVVKMVSNVQDFETIICDTEYEALMLENSLIKQHQPKYNILLKDDKGYHYIKKTAERWPKIEAVKQKENDKAEYLGPYYSFSVVRQTVDEALKIFKLPNCNRSFDKKSKPCLNFHIGLCSAPCMGKTSHSEYIETVSSAIEYIKKGGVGEETLDALNSRMIEAADNLDFELAARLRDRINAIRKSNEKQKVITSVHKRQDVFAIALAGELACVSVFIFVGGHLSDKRTFYLDGSTSKDSYYSQFLSQYYQNNGDIPPEIFVDFDFEDRALFEEWLGNMRETKVSITVPQRGAQKQLVDMCLTNASQALSDKIERNNRETSSVNELADLLGLGFVPRRIESYDISNTSGENNVGVMIVFIDGRPCKKLYRKFKIKSFIGQDDFRSLNEVLDRRFTEYESGTDESFKDLPDLILLDGGKGQLSAVRPILDKHKIDVSLFGMVKDSKHKTRAITAGGEDIQIKANRRSFTLVNEIQEEVHRFAITYHRNSNKSSKLKLDLTEIAGVGEITAAKLLKKYKTLSKIKTITEDEFVSDGFSTNVAKNIVEHFKN